MTLLRTRLPLATVLVSSLAAALITAVGAEAPATAMRTPPLPAHRSADGTTDQRVAGVKGKRVEVVAVGDIACAPGTTATATVCRQADTAELAQRIDPDAVLALGDTQYDVGALYAYRHSYADSWGQLKKITYPVPGNHEYITDGASGYYTYFKHRQPGAPGYYATNLGRWRMYGVNGNCSEIDCDAEAAWLRDDLSEHPRACSLFTMHFPRYSSGEHGSQTSMRRFFRIAFRHRVDVVLAGHDHHYERFLPMNHKGQLRRRGVTSFVSGGGGRSHYSADGDVKGSAFVEDHTFGVLRLVLRPSSFRYGFRGIDGSRQDNGTRACV